jgi:hypothetical protein
VSEEVTPEEIDSLCASAVAAADSWQLMREPLPQIGA